MFHFHHVQKSDTFSTVLVCNVGSHYDTVHHQKSHFFPRHGCCRKRYTAYENELRELLVDLVQGPADRND